MTVNTTNITGFVVMPNDTVREKSSVIFTMTGFDTDDDDSATIVPIPIEAPIAADGSIDIDLWPNPEGVRSTFYRVTFSIYNGNKPHLVDGGLIEVPATGGPYDLNDLLPIAPPQGATVDEYIAQLAASVAAADASASAAETSASNAATSESNAATSADEAAASADEAAASAASINPALLLAKADNLAGLADTDASLSNLGLTAIGKNLVKAATAAAMRTVLELKAGALAEKANQTEAEAGTDDAKYMTALGTAQAIAAQEVSLGAGQTWQDVLGSRALATSYQNTTGRSIFVAVRGGGSTGGAFQVSADNSTWVGVGTVGSSVYAQVFAVIPDGWYYRVLNGPTNLTAWAELR